MTHSKNLILNTLPSAHTKQKRNEKDEKSIPSHSCRGQEKNRKEMWAHKSECTSVVFPTSHEALKRRDTLASVHVRNILPIHNAPPIYASPTSKTHTLDKLRATELVVQVIGVLPHITHQKRAQSLYTSSASERANAASDSPRSLCSAPSACSPWGRARATPNRCRNGPLPCS